MTPLKEIGEVGISDSREGGKDYLLRPSFEAMTRIGEPGEIVSTFVAVHEYDAEKLHDSCVECFGEVQPWITSVVNRISEERLSKAIDVLQACCDEDLTELVGEWIACGHQISYKPGIMPASEIVIFAQQLMHHGVVGKAKVRRLQRHESNTGTSEFRAFEYINAARIHFDMSLDEARTLTMTEFQNLLAEKYPDQKGLTKEEYSDVADDFLAKQAARRAAAKK